MTGKTLGYAEVVATEDVTLSGLYDKFFMYDTDSRTWEESERSLNQHYHNDVHPDEPLVIYWLKWVKRGGHYDVEDVVAELPFAAEYPKLDFEVFPTIRRMEGFGDVGDVVEVVLTEGG